jgi:formylglycine-generating enzyme required for sulfatase activity
MRGNVLEWVQDWYDGDYYLNGPSIDPQGSARGTTRVARGGSIHLYPWLSRMSVRTSFEEDYRLFDLGFRVVREGR